MPSHHLLVLDDGKVISDPSTLLNDFFISPRIQESALELSEEDFRDHHSITVIENKSHQLDFAFKEIDVETITDYLLNLNIKKATAWS